MIILHFEQVVHQASMVGISLADILHGAAAILHGAGMHRMSIRIFASNV